MSKKDDKINNLRSRAQFVLFATSYIPLFILIMFKQISENYSFLVSEGVNPESIIVCIQKFGLSILFVVISIVGLIGYK